jgi:hypothetical protein
MIPDDLLTAPREAPQPWCILCGVDTAGARYCARCAAILATYEPDAEEPQV